MKKSVFNMFVFVLSMAIIAMCGLKYAGRMADGFKDGSGAAVAQKAAAEAKKAENEQRKEDARQTEQVAYEASKAESLQSIPEEVFNVTSADGEKLGEWAELSIPKSALKETTAEQFAAFCKERVEGGGYNWYTVACDDGTGIQFNGCFTGSATYGKIDNEGCVVETLGYITLGANGYEYKGAAE